MPSKSTEPSSGEMMMLRLDDFCLGSSLWSGGDGKIQRQRFCPRCQCQPACPGGRENAPSRCQQECQVCGLHFEFSFMYFTCRIRNSPGNLWAAFFFWDGKVCVLPHLSLLCSLFLMGLQSSSLFCISGKCRCPLSIELAMCWLPNSLCTELYFPTHTTAWICAPLTMTHRHSPECHYRLLANFHVHTQLSC